MSLALRRHHENRIKARFYRKNRLHPAWPNDERNAGQFAHHGKTCSCFMCGNPRRHFNERTMQERRAMREGYRDIAEEDWFLGEKKDV